MTPTELIYNNIRGIYTDMEEEELEVEFLTQMWVAALQKKVRIRKDDRGNHCVYFFHGANIVDNLPGVPIEPEQYYDETLSQILVEAIKRGYVYVVDKDGQGKDYIFKNSHDIDWDDFFIRAMSKEDAIKFTLDLIEEE